jgi:hypothetical protein
MFARLAATLCLALAPLLISVAPAQAATSTLNFKGSFSGGQLGDVTFDFTITRDFSVTEFSARAEITTGLTINSITSSVVAGDPFPVTGRGSSDPGFFGYSYEFDTRRSGDLLEFGTDSAVFEFDTGFRFQIVNISGTPSFGRISDSLAALPFTGEGMESGTTTLTVTDLTAPVPLPASALLLLGALGGTALMRRRARAA